jgi:hypothetical protein
VPTLLGHALACGSDRSGAPLWNDPWTWVGLISALAFVILAVEVNECEAIGFNDPVIA